MKYIQRFAIVTFAAALAFVALPAFAGNACYTPAQLQAEQALRLHSELMVITVTCREGSMGQSLPAAYGNFTKKNITVLHEAEQTMIAYYQSSGKSGAMDKLDRLRTRLANEFGQKAADMKSEAFCAAYRDKVVQYEFATPRDVEKEVQRMQISERSYVKPCRSISSVAVRKIN